MLDYYRKLAKLFQVDLRLITDSWYASVIQPTSRLLLIASYEGRKKTITMAGNLNLRHLTGEGNEYMHQVNDGDQVTFHFTIILTKYTKIHSGVV